MPHPHTMTGQAARRRQVGCEWRKVDTRMTLETRSSVERSYGANL